MKRIVTNKSYKKTNQRKGNRHPSGLSFLVLNPGSPGFFTNEKFIRFHY